MKKLLKKATMTLMCIITAAVLAFAGTIQIRGNIDDYILPKGFNEALEQADTKRDDNTYARIMSLNLLANYEDWGGTDAHRRAKMFFNLLDVYRPDVAAIQEMSNQWYCCIMKNLDNYKLIYPISSGALIRMTGIIYNSDTVNLLDYGQYEYSQGDNARIRRIVWGLFEDRNTSKQYIVSSTHFDLVREGNEKAELATMKTQTNEHISLMNQLKNEFNCPVFSCGDFNAMDCGGYNNIYYAPEIYETIAQNLTDTKYIAKIKTHGNERSVDKPTFDHIFLLGDEKIKRYSIISDNVMTQMSDHYPIFIDAA